MGERLDIAFFGSSLVSSWWNGACTYYRGIIQSLSERGHRVTFYEPRAFDRQLHRDVSDPPYARVVVYEALTDGDVWDVVSHAAGADVVVKTSGVGVFDDTLAEAVAATGSGRSRPVFWDVDSPATLTQLEHDTESRLRQVLPAFDVVLSYGGGRRVVDRYLALGARDCQIVYNAVDPRSHHPVPRVAATRADCALLANRLPDREARIDEFFFRPARLLPEHSFVLGGNGWEGKRLPPNVRWIGHVGTERHNEFNCSSRCVLNVTRSSMAQNGWSPPTRIFEAAGAGACLISDRWPGIEEFLEPDDEILLASDGQDVAAHLVRIDDQRAARIGQRAQRRVLASHTYAQRGAQVDALLRQMTGALG